MTKISPTTFGYHWHGTCNPAGVRAVVFGPWSMAKVVGKISRRDVFSHHLPEAPDLLAGKSVLQTQTVLIFWICHAAMRLKGSILDVVSRGFHRESKEKMPAYDVAEAAHRPRRQSVPKKMKTELRNGEKPTSIEERDAERIKAASARSESTKHEPRPQREVRASNRTKKERSRPISFPTNGREGEKVAAYILM